MDFALANSDGKGRNAMEDLCHTLYEALCAAAGVELAGRNDSADQNDLAAQDDSSERAESGAQALPLLIRRAYSDPAPPPETGRDVLYYDLTPDPRPPHREEAPPPEGGLEYFRAAPWRLSLVFYGEGALDLAWRFYHLLYLDGPGSPRQIMRRAGIYPVPGGPGPVLIREEWQKGRRTRADLTVPLMIAERMRLSAGAVPAIEEAPDVRIHVT